MLVDKNRTPADPNRVSLAEEWEVHWWCDKFGCTEVALRSAVDRAGPDANGVAHTLKEAGKEALKNTGED